MTSQTAEDKATSELLEWGICERNKDGELKPTSDFLVWYFECLIYEITQTGFDYTWNEKEDSDIVEEADEDFGTDSFTKEEFIKLAIENEICMWTAQTIDGATVCAKSDVKEHVEIFYRLIKEIDERLTYDSDRKTSSRK